MGTFRPIYAMAPRIERSVHVTGGGPAGVIHNPGSRWEKAPHLTNNGGMNTTGIASYRDLRKAGHSRREITEALETGAITRFARGWYASANADREAMKAIQLGGRLGCLSGCQRHGLWIPPNAGSHIVYGEGCTPARRRSSMHFADAPQPKTAIWPLLDCLDHVVHRHSTETSLIVLESALNLKLVTRADVRRLLLPYLTRGDAIGRHLSCAESGSETRVRLFLQQRQVRVRPQVAIAGVGRVDLLVGRSLIIECDSQAHHSGATDYENDRARDLAARDLGYDTMRLSYRQIWRQWPSTMESILRQVHRQEHLDLA